MAGFTRAALHNCPLAPGRYAAHFFHLQNCAFGEEGFHAFAFWWEYFRGREGDKRNDSGFSCTWIMAGLPFEHGSMFGVMLQWMSHLNWTLALDQLHDGVGRKLTLALSIGWIQDRACLEICPWWLESASTRPVKPEEMSPDRWVGQDPSWKGSYCMTRRPMGFRGGWAAGC